MALSTPGSDCQIGVVPGMACVLCHATERAFFYRKGEASGICEPCVPFASWAFRQLAGEVPPGFSVEASRQIARVSVLISRRRLVPKSDGDPGEMIAAPAELSSSYEFALTVQSDGSLDLPSISGLSLPSSILSHPSSGLHEAVRKALATVGLRTWDPLIEVFHVGYGPRGRLVAVVLVRGWAIASPGAAVLSPSPSALQWLGWPLAAHTGGMEGFYRFMEPVWGLRLYKHCSVGQPEEMCVRVREAGARYIDLQSDLRAGRTTDSSMLVALASGMSPDELHVARQVTLTEGKSKGERSLVAPVAQPIPNGSAIASPTSKGKSRKMGKRDWPELALQPEHVDEESTSISDESVQSDLSFDDQSRDEDSLDQGSEIAEGEEDDSSDDSDDDSGDDGEDEGFVRPGRPLSQER